MRDPGVMREHRGRGNLGGGGWERWAWGNFAFLPERMRIDGKRG